MATLAQRLEELGGADITAALEEISVRAFVVGRDGIVRWQNAASRAALGDWSGRQWTDVPVPGWSRQVGDFLLDVLSSGEPAEFSFEVEDLDGQQRLREVSVAPLRNGETVVGIFGVSTTARSDVGATPPAEHDLTPRQLQILQLLADGRSTTQIADDLHLSKTTVRNHIANILANLRVHTRVQAVVTGSRLGLIGLPPSRPGGGDT